MGVTITFVMGYLASFLFEPPPDSHTRGLTMWTKGSAHQGLKKPLMADPEGIVPLSKRLR
jgi:hypothetical protein